MSNILTDSNGFVYKISENGDRILQKLRADDSWHELPSAGQKFKDIRLNPSGAGIEVLTNDGHWRERTFSGGWGLTAEEQNKVHQAKADEKAAKKARQQSKKSSKSSCGFCSVFKCLLKTVLNLLCLGAILGNSNDK